MSLLGQSGRSLDGPDRDGRPVRGHVELRPAVRSTLLGSGTVACPACDAPVAIGPDPRGVAEPLDCPYCDHRGALREFLSMAAPNRPARVAVHLHASAVRRPTRSRP